VRELITARAIVDAKNNNGDNALMYAAYKGHFKIVKDLITARAIVDANNNKGNTALNSVLQKYKDSSKKVSKNIYLRIAKLLIDNKATYNINELPTELKPEEVSNLGGGKKTKRKTRKSKKTRRRRHSKRRR